MASSNRAGEPVWIAPSAAAQIGGETLPPLILNALGTRTAIDARLDGSIQDGSIESTTKGAPTLTLSVLDPDGEMLNSNLFSRRIDLDMDNVPFRLVQVSRQEDDLLSLEFEHRLCSWLREHDTPRKASRGTKTRAEFAYSLVLEVKKEPIHFVSPDLDKRQPRAAEAVRPSTRKGRDGRKAPGFLDRTNLRLAGAPATRSQLKEADKAMSVAFALKASPLATKAMVVAGIGESEGFKVIPNRQGSDYGGVFQGKFKGSSPGYPLWDIHDTEGMAQCFLKGGRGFQGGGAMALARQRPPLSPGGIAFRVEGDISNFGGNAARAAAFYDKWGDEADALIDAWRGSSGSGGSGGPPDAQKTGFAKFEFTRGAIHKGDAKEDSWMALQRLADEVRWRCFIDGRNVFYFVSDEQLMRSRPLYLVDRETPGVRSVTFDMEVGRRTVIYKGRRQRKPSEAILRVRMGRWAAPPGSVIELADYGLADGRWLVDSMSRGIFDAEAEVHLRQPQKALPEPAASTTSGGTGSTGSRASSASQSGGPRGSSSVVDKVYAKALEIHRRNLPYGPGGHGQVWGAADQAPSLDCSSSTSLALNAGGLMSNVRGPVVSDWFRNWGEVGQGKYMTVWVHPGAGPNGHVWIQFHGRNAKRFDTSPWGSGGRGPHMRYTDRPVAGFESRHWPGT
jgi:hypothetical protein